MSDMMELGIQKSVAITTASWGRTPVLRPTSTSACAGPARRAGPGGPAQTWRSAPPLLFRMHIHRVGSHDEVARRAGHAVFVRAMIHHWVLAAEVVKGRRRRHGPLQRGRFPRVHGRLLAAFHAPEKINEEEDLRRRGEISRLRHEGMHWEQFAQEVEIGEV